MKLRQYGKKNHGFTLLELLTVVAIIGILAAIAVPQFDAYKKRGFDIRAKSDLRSVAIAEEAYFIDYEAYRSCAGDDCLELPGIGALSKGVELGFVAGADGFVGTALHTKGTGTTFEWDSLRGGMQESGG